MARDSTDLEYFKLDLVEGAAATRSDGQAIKPTREGTSAPQKRPRPRSVFQLALTRSCC